MKPCPKSLCVLFALALALVIGCSSESRKARHLERGERYFQAEEFERAELEYLNALRLDPANTRATRHLGLIYFEQGKPSLAYPFLMRATETNPKDIDVRIKLASVYLAGRRFKEARDQAALVLQQQPGNSEALVITAESTRNSADINALRTTLSKLAGDYQTNAAYHVALGTLAFRSKQPGEAEKEFNRALEIDSTNPFAHSALATLYTARGNFAQAGAHFKAAHDISPARSPRRLDYIDYKLRTGDLPTARTLLRDVIVKAPDYLPALNREVEFALLERNYSEAETLLRDILGRVPRNFEALMLQGRLYLAKGDAAKALGLFERIRGTYSAHPQVEYCIALASFAQNNLARAIRSLQQTLVLDPNHLDAKLLLAQLYLRRGDSLGTIALLTEIVEKRPQTVQAYHLLGAAYRMRNNYEKAAEMYRQVSAAFPKDPQGPMLLGSIYLLQVKTNLARQEFEKSFTIAPNYLPALQSLIAVDLDEQNFDGAFRRIQAELEQHPRAPELWILLAKAYSQQAEHDQVEKALRKAIELNPLYREPYLLLASLFVGRKKHEAAIHELEVLLANRPSDRTALMLLGSVYRELKDKAGERQAYEKLLAVDPQFSPALNSLAYLYAEHFHEVDKAYELANRARDLMPSDAPTADTLGWIILKRGDYPWALSLLQESSSKMPDNPEATFHVAMAHYMMGQEREAIDHFQRALQSEKDFHGKEAAKHHLAVLQMDPASLDAAGLAVLEGAIVTDKRDVIAMSRLAAAYRLQGKHDRALQLLQQARAVNPQSVAFTFQLADLYARHLSQPQKAIELAKAARALAPDDPLLARAVGRLAVHGAQVADADWAVGLLQEAARHLDDEPDVLYELARAQFNAGRIHEAQTALRTALKAEKKLSDASSAKRLSSAITAIQAPERAREIVADGWTSAENNSNDPAALMVDGIIKDRENHLQAAVAAYEAVLRQIPAFTPAHERLSILYLGSLNDAEKAAAYAQKARERMPENALYAKLLGIANFKMGDFARSLPLLRDCARDRVKDAEVFYYLGLAHFRLDQKRESKEALRQALALKLPSAMASEAKRIVAEL